MKKITTIVRKAALIGLLALVSACTADEELTTEQAAPIELTNYVAGYKANATNKTNRTNGSNETNETNETYWTNETNEANRLPRRVAPAWVPAGFSQDESGSHPAIGVFLTQDGEEPLAAKIYYASDKKWRIKDLPENFGTYYFYGYVPKDAATASIAPNGTYSDGAVLTLEGLGPVSGKDVCIVVGAKDGTSASTVEGLEVGKFAVNVKSGGTGYENFLFVLYDHLYAAIKFQFKVEPTYAELRTIKIKTLEMTVYTDNEFTTKMKESITNTITLTKNGRSPMVDEADYQADPSPVTETPSGEDMDSVRFFHSEDEPVELNSSEWRGNMISYVTKNLKYFVLRTTFDVYDSKGHLTRQDCVAENKVDAEEYLGALKRGYMYTLKFTVNPTYLYMLSEYDLDNPTIKLE